MPTVNSNWSYNEFLAFVLVFGAEMNYPLSKEELEFIRSKSNIADINEIKAKVDEITDAEGLEIIDSYRAKYLNSKEQVVKAKQDLEELLKTDGKHSQLEKVAVHLIEKLL